MPRYFGLALIACVLSAAVVAQAPAAAPAARKVNFHKDIVPILANSCVKCHANANRKGGLSLDTREKLLEGGDSGAAVAIGNSQDSLLVHLISGAEPEMIMPAQGPRLTAEQIALMKAWIDQGLAWDEGFTFRKVQAAPLAPRRPTVPESNDPALANPIDRILQPYFAKHQIKLPTVADDRTYIRRVYLDVIGVLPTVMDVQALVDDASPDKRSRLVDRVLADRMRYAEHWMTFWNDALRNDYRGTGYIDGGRRQITGWLYAALADNMPYDQFVRELIDPSPASEGFINGIVWRGVVNASQVPPVQAAQNVSQVFMGINLKCASCHDSFINDWKLSDAYGLAGIFSDDRLEMHRCDKPTGEFAKIKFLYPELGSIDGGAARGKRLEQLSAVLTGEENGRLARTIVNRLWARLLGRGLIEPVDEMDAGAWNSDLLDYLASDLVDHDYNLKHTLARILTSRVYQLPAMAFSEADREDFVFRGPTVKRMSAEQFVDAVADLTETVAAPGVVSIPLTIGRDAAGKASWIWKDGAADKAAAPKVLFRKEFDVAEQADRAWLVAASTVPARLYVNGAHVLDLEPLGSVRDADIMPHIAIGKNVVAIQTVAADVPKRDGKTGVYVYGRAEVQPKTGVGRARHFEIATDPAWLCSTDETEGWKLAGFDALRWQAADKIAAHEGQRWQQGDAIPAAIGGRSDYDANSRASLAYADPLMVALGRPNREQVVTDRPKLATTLQALEMTNGAALASLLANASNEIVAREPQAPSVIAEKVYNRGVGRPPTNAELAAALEVIGSPATAEGVEDLLWSIVMLPDFQLIY